MDPSEISPKAYALFLSEAESHISWLIDFCEKTERSAASDKEEAERRAHTMKGASGFFGLDKFQNLAAELELLFQEQVADLVKAKEILEGLKLELGQIKNNC